MALGPRGAPATSARYGGAGWPTLAGVEIRWARMALIMAVICAIILGGSAAFDALDTSPEWDDELVGCAGWEGDPPPASPDDR